MGRGYKQPFRNFKIQMSAEVRGIATEHTVDAVLTQNTQSDFGVITN